MKKNKDTKKEPKIDYTKMQKDDLINKKIDRIRLNKSDTPKGKIIFDNGNSKPCPNCKEIMIAARTVNGFILGFQCSACGYVLDAITGKANV